MKAACLSGTCWRVDGWKVKTASQNLQPQGLRPEMGIALA